MKDQTIPFRVDEHTRQKLKATSERMSMSSSEFLRKAIWSHEELVSKSNEAAVLSKKISEQNVLNAKLNDRLKAYEDNKNLKRIFDSVRGHKINGTRIGSLSDLLLVITEKTTIDSINDTDDTAASELGIQPIELKVEPTAPITIEKSEPVTMEDIHEWFKQNFALFLISAGVGLIFLINRWVNKMSKRPKFVTYPPSAIEYQDSSSLKG